MLPPPNPKQPQLLGARNDSELFLPKGDTHSTCHKFLIHAEHEILIFLYFKSAEYYLCHGETSHTPNYVSQTRESELGKVRSAPSCYRHRV